MSTSDWLGLIGISALVAFFVLVGLVALGLDLVGALVPRVGPWWRDVQVDVARQQQSRGVRFVPPMRDERAVRDATTVAHEAAATAPTLHGALPGSSEWPARQRTDYEIPAGYPANWHELRREVYRRDSYTCYDGGETNVRLVAHHIVPIWDGGGHEMSNLITLCEPCHDRRHALISAERRELRRRLRSQFRWDGQTVAAAIIAILMVAWVVAAVLVSR